MKPECISENRWKLCKDKFDMAALCHDMITESIGTMSMAVFIAQYFDCGKAGAPSNPNIELLGNVTNEVKTILHEEPVPENQVTAVWNCIKKGMAELVPFANEAGNVASIFLAVLEGIDLDVLYRRNRGDRLHSGGPLNRLEHLDSLVYLKSNRSLMDDLKERYRYRTIVDEGGLSDFLQAIVVFRKDCLLPECGYPKVMSLEIHEGRVQLKKQLEKERVLRVAIIPGDKPRNFLFDEESTSGSTFCVRYPETREEIIERCRHQLQVAVQQGANLIVLPEFFISPDILAAIESWLREHQADAKSLIAVFAGTTWTNDNNNVMHVFDHRGKLLGKYYKYSSFTKLPLEEESRDTYDMCERLTKPGKEAILLDVEGIGRILPAVCRDVIDGKYTERLVKQFGPAFLVTSAYSTSVNSFKRHYESYASRYYVVSILCNACEAVSRGASLDLCTIPDKEESEMRFYTKEIRKCRNPKAECAESCCIMVNLNFRPAKKGQSKKRAEITYKRMA